MTITVTTSGLAGAEVAAVRYLLYPYEVEIVQETEGSDLMITRGAPDSACCSRYSKSVIRVPTRNDIRGDAQPLDHGNGIVDLPFDLIAASAKKFESVMNPKVALLYSLSTCLPFRYNLVPPSIRSRILRIHEVDSVLSDHLANETCRRILTEAICLLGFHLKRKNPPAVMITHDIDSKKGLESAAKIKSVDDNLNVRSTWFLPSDEYPIGGDLAKDLANNATIGSHDTKHDGTLIRVQQEEELVNRLRESRLKLEGIFAKEVRSFRSPLLQFSRRIMTALGKAGYQFDFSVPCWEPAHPQTLGGFGVESVQTFEMGGVNEIPLTLYQDHQVLHVLGLNTKQAVKLWLEQAALVRSLNGDVVLLIHPDYAFSRDLKAYRALLTSLVQAS